METWNVKRILDWIEAYLSDKGCGNARFSAQWLVADTLGCSRLELYTMLDRVLTDAEREMLRDYTTRRGSGEPLQYITGTCYFRFVALAVAPGVLIPRPETEVLVSEALAALDAAFPPSGPETSEAATLPDLSDAALVDLGDAGLFLQTEGAEPIPVAFDDDGDVVLRDDAACEREPLVAVDLCTGSGNIACALAKERPNLRVYATDISPEACALARQNVESLGLVDQVKVLEGDLGDALPESLRGTVSLLVSNPPYIPTAELDRIDAEVIDFEPRLALDGGADGLDVFRRILLFAKTALRPGGVLAVELHETCLEDACALAKADGFKDCRIAPDLAGKPRVLIGRV